jgi:TPR repeat protein
MRKTVFIIATLLLAAPAAAGAADAKLGEMLARAERGDAWAQTMLGFMYLRGEQVVADIDQAARWFLRASQQGSFTARYALGTLLCPTCVPKPDYAEQVARYRAAAEHGAALAQANLASLLADGRGTAKDPVEALMWYELATQAQQQGVAEFAQRRRDALAQRLTPQQIAEARARAAGFRPKTTEPRRN